MVQQQAIDEMKKSLKRRSFHLTLFFLFFLMIWINQTNRFLTRKKDSLLKKGCAKFCGSRAIADHVSQAPFCYRAFMAISWVRNFLSCLFSSWIFRLLHYKISFAGYMRKGDGKQYYINTSQTEYSIANWLKHLVVVFMLEIYFIY